MKKMTKKKKTNDLREQQALENRWVFDVANVMMEEGCMGRSEALRQGYLANKLLETLGRGEVRFVYEKKDRNHAVQQGREAVFGLHFVKTFGRVWSWQGLSVTSATGWKCRASTAKAWGWWFSPPCAMC